MGVGSDEVAYEDRVEDSSTLLDPAPPAPTPDEPSPYKGWSDAKIYVELARAVIAAEFLPENGITRWDIRTWWRDEEEHRKDYRLTQAQITDLKDRCRVACGPLPEGSKRPEEWPDEQKKPRKAYGGRGSGPIL